VSPLGGSRGLKSHFFSCGGQVLKAPGFSVEGVLVMPLTCSANEGGKLLSADRLVDSFPRS